MSLDLGITPEFKTTCLKPFYFLEQQFLAHRLAIEKWFAEQWQLTSPPVYGSVDLRNAGFKLAPIDMNLFPAGFNNLNPRHLPYSIQAAKKILQQISPLTKKILIIPESHTRNLFYWKNVQTLQTILEGGGFQVKLGILDETIQTPLEIDLTESKVIVEPLKREANHLHLDHFNPDIILLNNDLSSGIPTILQGLEQQIIPPAELGWSQRLKSEHFQYYANVANEFAKVVDIDPWLISPLFKHCGEIDFMQQEGLDCLIHHAETLFNDLQKKYDHYQITHQPFLIIKADAGTYGMAVMTVRDVGELTSLNRKQRTRMATTKGGQPVRRVIIQEGVYTFETVGEAVAEPVVYLWGSTVVGGFYRIHKNRGVDENLNAPGMHFEPMPFSQSCHSPDENEGPATGQNRFYLYGVVAQLSTLAAAREMKDQISK